MDYTVVLIFVILSIRYLMHTYSIGEGYDFGTGTYKHTILPNGHCNCFVQSEYDSTSISCLYNNM